MKTAIICFQSYGSFDMFQNIDQYFVNDQVTIGWITWALVKLFEVYFVLHHTLILIRFWIYGRAYLDCLHSPQPDGWFVIVYYVYVVIYNFLYYWLTFQYCSKDDIIEYIIFHFHDQHDLILYVCQFYFLRTKIQAIRHLQSCLDQANTNLCSMHRQVVRLSMDVEHFNQQSNRILLSAQVLAYTLLTVTILYCFLYQMNTFYNLIILVYGVSTCIVYALLYAVNTIMANLYHSLRATLVNKASRTTRCRQAACKIRIDRLLVEGHRNRQMSLWLYDFCPLTIDVFGEMINFVVILAITLYQTDAMI